MHDYLMKPHILGYGMSWSRSPLKVKGHNFWSHRDGQLIFSVQMYLMKPHVLSGYIIRSMSFFKVKGQMLSLGHNFRSRWDRDLIFIMHVYFLKLHILNMSRSRLSLKVNGQMNITFESIEKWTLYIWACMCISWKHIFL